MGYRYKATFDAQVWIGDYAVSVDPDGPASWDCTSFVVNPPELIDPGYFLELISGEDEDFIDLDDVLRNDPAMPKWASEWDGPFTITVERIDTDKESMDQGGEFD